MKYVVFMINELCFVLTSPTCCFRPSVFALCALCALCSHMCVCVGGGGGGVKGDDDDNDDTLF